MIVRFSTYLVQFVLICSLAFLGGGCVRFGFNSSGLVEKKDGGAGTDVLNNDFSISDQRLTSSDASDAGMEKKDLDLKQDKGGISPDQTIIADLGIRDAKPPLPDIPPRMDIRDMKLGDIVSPISFVKIPASTFMMGSPEDEPCRSADETQHQVKLTNAFEMMATKVTNHQFYSLLGQPYSLPPNFSAFSYTYWDQAASWCNALSEKQKLTPCYECKTEIPTGACSKYVVIRCKLSPEYSQEKIYQCPGYRLPTEAEWEYAYRAGTTTAFYNGDITSCGGQDPLADEIGWYSKNSKNEPHDVRQKMPNAFGLYDMAGNSWEWANDAYIEDLGSDSVENPFGPTFSATLPPCDRQAKVERGGTYYLGPQYMRAAQRGSEPGQLSASFRCVRTLPP